jgi:hypothetical protein
MKKYNLIISSVVMCLFSIVGYADEQSKGLNIGFKGGAFMLEDENSVCIFSVGGTVGYTLPLKNKYFELALETDFNLGCFGGDYVSGAQGEKSHIRTFGAYAVINTIPSKEIYFKGKAGITHETEFETEVDFETGDEVETPYEEIGPSFGIGVGYNASDNVNVEVELTTTNSDMKFLSVGFKFLL